MAARNSKERLKVWYTIKSKILFYLLIQIMTDILEQLTKVADGKDELTKQKILIIKEQLAWLLTPPNPDNPAFTPSQFLTTQKLLPEVIELTKITNTLLLSKLQWKSCSLKQADIVQAWENQNENKEFKFARLDAMERCFRDAGRKVEYDSPWRDENYDSCFRFTMR